MREEIIEHFKGGGVLSLDTLAKYKIWLFSNYPIFMESIGDCNIGETFKIVSEHLQNNEPEVRKNTN